MDEYGVDLLEDLRIRTAANSGQDPTGNSESAKATPFKFKKKDVPSLAQYIQSDGCRKIYLMVSII
jgi:hypothetical protein